MEGRWMQQRPSQILTLLLAFLVAENGLLLYRNHSLGKRVKAPARPPSLAIGELIGPVRVRSMDGQETSISMAEDTLVFVYSEKCPYSRKSFSGWKVLESKAVKQHVYYLSTDLRDPPSDRLAFAKGQHIESKAFLFADEQEIARLKLFSVPQTLRIIDNKLKTIDVGLLSAERETSIGEQCDEKI